MGFSPDGGYEPDAEAAKAVLPVAKYLVGWQRPGDFGFIAEQNGEIICAALARRFSAEELKFHYGDDETPKVSISVKPNAVVRGYRVPSRAITTTCSAKGCAGKFLVARYSIEEQSRPSGSEIPRRSCSVGSNDRSGLVVGCVSRRQ